MCSFSQKRHKGAGRPWGERCTTCSTPQMDLLCLLWGFTLSLRALPTSSVSQWGYKFSNRIHSKRDQQARPQKSYSSAYPCSHLPCPLQCDTALASSRKPSIIKGTTSDGSFVKISVKLCPLCLTQLLKPGCTVSAMLSKEHRRVVVVADLPMEQ